MTIFSTSRRSALAGLAALATAPWPTLVRADAPTSGRLVEITDMASAHVQPRHVTVWLPPGYDGGQARYPVLYIHDGQNLFDGTKAAYGVEWGVDEHLARLASGGQVRPAIVVGVWNTPLRRREYVPADLIAALPYDVREQVQSIYGGSPLSDGYLRFLVEELKPTIDAAYRTMPGPADTVIAGSSMGGLISLYAVLKYPEVFGAAGCLSTHWPLRLDTMTPEQGAAWRDRIIPAYAQVIGASLPPPGTHRFYFDHGDETLDASYSTFQVRIDAEFRRHGYGPDRFRSLVFPGAQHNEQSWNERLDTPLTFLLPPVQS